MLFGAAFDGGALTVPGGRLGSIVVLGVIAGVAAAWRPARRSARLPILEAITNPS
jgi:putative ABC transport system permease protein